MTELDFLLTATGAEIFKAMKNDEISDQVIVIDYYEKASSNFLPNEQLTARYFFNSIMDFSKISILNTKTIKQELTAFKVFYYVSLDTNFLGDLNSVIFNKKENEEIYKVIDYIKNQKMTLDFNPYLLENKMNVHQLNKVIFHQNIQAFETLEKFVKDKDRSIKNTYGNYKLEILQRADNRFYKVNKEYSKIEEILNYYYYAYVMLLKMFEVKFKDVSKSVTKMIDKLIDFVVTNLTVYGENEFVVAILYLQNEKQLDNFFPIKPNSKNKTNKIRGMAWDLTHIRYMELMMKNLSLEQMSIHYLLTADKGLTRILSLNPVQRIILKESPVFSRKYNIHNIGLSENQIEKMCNWRFSKKSGWDTDSLIELGEELEKIIETL